MAVLLFDGNLVIGLSQVHFAEHFGSVELGGEVPQVWDRICVGQSLLAELTEVPTWTVRTVWLWLEV